MTLKTHKNSQSISSIFPSFIYENAKMSMWTEQNSIQQIKIEFTIRDSLICGSANVDRAVIMFVIVFIVDAIFVLSIMFNKFWL